MIVSLNNWGSFFINGVDMMIYNYIRFHSINKQVVESEHQMTVCFKFSLFKCMMQL